MMISGQGLYIRSANPVQAQGLVTGVQTAMNTNFKNPNQQTLQVTFLLALIYDNLIWEFEFCYF